MKKIILWAALFTLICTQVQAEGSQYADTTQVAAQEQSSQNPQQSQATHQMPDVAPAINCNYKIPADTKKIEQSLILNWSEKAVLQAFEFNPETIDIQIQKLQACFTGSGWIGFNNALEKSGNVKTIKTQNLIVSSQLDGRMQLTESKDNQWKITLPLQVIYHNDKEKITQLLTVNLIIVRKINGDPGIVQMIATPRTATVNQPDKTNASANINAAATKLDTPAANQISSNTNAPEHSAATENTDQPVTLTNDKTKPGSSTIENLHSSNQGL